MKQAIVGALVIACLLACQTPWQRREHEREWQAQQAAAAERIKARRAARDRAIRNEAGPILADIEKNVVGPLTDAERDEALDEMVEANQNGTYQRSVDECMLAGFEPLSDMMIRCFRTTFADVAAARQQTIRRQTAEERAAARDERAIRAEESRASSLRGIMILRSLGR